MNSQQFSKYLELLDHPIQLPLNADVSSLYYLYRQHITRFSYQSLDLWLGKPIVNLSISALLQDLSLHGGHCYQHSELMIAALEYVGFEVHRIAAWVLMNREYQEWMPLNHIFIQVRIGQDFYICDPGLASASPRFPVKFKMDKSEEITISEGEHYKLEVQEKYYNLFWMLKESWLLLYRFARNISTGLPKTSKRGDTLEMCKCLYECPEYIPIRDKYVKISRQTDDSRLDFYYSAGSYIFRKYQRGEKTKELKDMESVEFFQLIKEMCSLEFEISSIPPKELKMST